MSTVFAGPSAPAPPPKGRIAGVLTNVLTGADPFRLRVAQNLLEQRPADEAWAVLDNTGASALRDHGAHLVAMDKDCLCCTGSVTLRVTLTRLLRQARPRRLIVLPSAQARLAEVLAVLSDPWLSAALDLRAAVALAHAGDWHAGTLAARQASLAMLREAQAAAVEFGEDAIAAGAMREALTGVDHVVALASAELPPALLDQAGVRARSRFPVGDE